MIGHFNGKMIKKNGKLKYSTLALSKQFELFVSDVEEGQIVEFFFEATHDDGTLPQLAKIHAILKTLSLHTGILVEDLKLLVKDKAGLCIAREVSGKEYFLAKSFGDCSKDELGLAIQAIIDLGNDVGCPVG